MKTSVGTGEKLIEEGSRAGVSGYVVHSVATTAHQVHSINEFIKRETDEHKEFIGFMTLHQDLSEDEIKNEVDWCIKNGFKGVKLHPDFHKFKIDEERVEKLFRIIGDRVPILMHMGDDRFDFSKPFRLVNTAKKHPEVKFIAAHFGGYLCWDDAYMYKGLKNIYFDTCSSLPFISTKRAKEIIEMLGVEKFFFGTDFPMWDTCREIERIKAIGLSQKELEMIFSGNIKKFLKLV